MSVTPGPTLLLTRVTIVGFFCLAALIPSGMTLAQSAGQWHDPEEIYGKICQYCHTTGVGPVLEGRQLQPAYVVATVRSGRNGMPSFRPSEISNDELLALGQWLERSNPGRTP
jgi:mono/diheme cytochrome c family protein